MDVTEIGWEAVDWIHLAWERGKRKSTVNVVL